MVLSLLAFCSTPCLYMYMDVHNFSISIYIYKDTTNRISHSYEKFEKIVVVFFT